MNEASVSGGLKTVKSSFSLRRVLAVLIPAALLVAGAVYLTKTKIESDAKAAAERETLEKLGLKVSAAGHLGSEFADADGDLLPDPPKDPAKSLDPETLVFSYIGADDSARQKEVWAEFMTALAAATGKKVEYLILDGPDTQFAALKSGKLHVTAINTGNVPAAVNGGGFVPDVVLADTDGKSGHTMQLVVPSSSKIEKIEQLKGKKLAFVNKTSNSGFKAPLVLLMKDFKMLPQRDFEYAWTYGHDESIRGIAAEDYEAAAVASDMLARAVSRGEIKPDQYRVIYESERFPSAALGHVYNLKPDLVEKIKSVYTTFAWPGTGLEKEFAPANVVKFAPVDYKENWALIRMIGDYVTVEPTKVGDALPLVEETATEKSAE